MVNRKIIFVAILSLSIFLAGCGVIFLSPDATEEDLTALSGGDNESLDYLTGSWDGNTYTNEFAGITFNLPEGWYHFTNKQLGNNDLNSFYGMIARGPSDSPSIVMIFDKLSDEDMKNNFSATDYLTGVLNSYAENYPNFILNGIENADVDGNAFKTFYLIRDDSTYMRYFARVVDNYMLSISIIAPSLDEIDKVVENFSSNKEYTNANS